MQIGPKMAMLKEKNPKMDPKKRFFSKIPLDFELLKQVPESSHQTMQPCNTIQYTSIPCNTLHYRLSNEN